MEFDATFFALAIPAVIFAAISKGGFASGAAFAATPILALVIPPAAPVTTMTVSGANISPGLPSRAGTSSRLIVKRRLSR